MLRNSMVAALSSVLIASLTPVFSFAQSEDPAVRVTVPRTSPAIMVDGVFSSGEWNSAAKVELPQVANIYFQTSAEFVYIAIEFTRSPSGMVDLFVSPANGQVYDLHASAKLGERQLNRSGYPEWVWWTNRDWTANVSRADSFEKRTFLPTRVREFQLRRARFGGNSWRIRFELTPLNAENKPGPPAMYPLSTSGTSTTGWLELWLEGVK
jgi:hypothetical protein